VSISNHYNDLIVVFTIVTSVRHLGDFPTISMEVSPDEIKNYYTPKDFMIGKTLLIANRRLLM